MSASKVLGTELLKKITNSSTVTNGSKVITLKWTTWTLAWKRSFLAESVKDDFCKAMEKADIPSNATTAILVEKEHESTSDNKTHFTVLYRDADDKDIGIHHVYPRQEQ